ncbi:MAG TPA: hypothetical protein VG753_00030 [Candidatus Paceibacterota bacterium]|nr:hypothetical protein [Candidatus Paceibacterota bacterium]
MPFTFSIKEALIFGWHKTKSHSKVLFQVLLSLFALQVAQAIVQATLPNTLIGWLATIALAIAQIVVSIGLTLVSLKIAKGQAVSFNDALPPAKLCWQYLAASIVAGFITVLGLLLLIIPGIYLAVRFSMVSYAVLEGAGITGSIKKSGKITYGVKWQMLGFIIVISLINILGAMIFMVGLLITMPVTMIAYAHVYEKLDAHHRAA